ncbi:MAG: hypothetical protein EZS28_049088 [Streblomastix strix]|uniref:Uncharacterized protein n=1 Tax=Streblomastix strix TaxID=222440 RepID=A0A5J4TD50_9EUKA|nr:MAG: hypothetical protein EZS28_049088 [Streblomastix strix]
MQNFNLDSTKQRFIAIYSMMIKTFALPQFRVGSSIKELIDFHLQGHKNYSPLQRIREHSREHMAKEHMMKYYNISEKQLQNWLQDYKGFDIDSEIDKFIQDEKININIYDYDTEQKIYYQSKAYKYLEDGNEADNVSSEPSAGPFGAESDIEPVSVPEFNVLICSSENETHAFYIQNKETLTGLRFCPFCKSKAFDPKEHHFAEQYERHIMCSFAMCSRECSLILYRGESGNLNKLQAQNQHILYLHLVVRKQFLWPYK